MTTKEHGVGIAIKRIGDKLFVEMTMIGKLTHEDYKFFVPMIDGAINATPNVKMNMLADLRKLEGWEPRAAWDDFKFGLEHRADFNKMAFVGNKTWEKLSAKIANWWVSGETRYFEDRETALAWLEDDD